MTDNAKQGKANRAKGQRFERDVAKYLGWEKDSRGGYTGHDLSGEGHDAECKDTLSGAGMALRYLEAAEQQGMDGNAHIAVMKARGKETGEAVVAMRLKDFRTLLGKRDTVAIEDIPELHHQGVLAIAVPDGILVVTDITEPHGTLVAQHTGQGFLIKQRGGV